MHGTYDVTSKSLEIYDEALGVFLHCMLKKRRVNSTGSRADEGKAHQTLEIGKSWATTRPSCTSARRVSAR